MNEEFENIIKLGLMVLVLNLGGAILIKDATRKKKDKKKETIYKDTMKRFKRYEKILDAMQKSGTSIVVTVVNEDTGKVHKLYQ